MHTDSPFVEVSLGAIEDALFRSGACRFECSNLAGLILDGGLMAELHEDSLRSKGVYPEVLEKELRAIGVELGQTNKRFQ